MKKLFLLSPFLFGFFGLNGMTVGQEPKDSGHQRRLSDEAQALLDIANELEALSLDRATTPEISQSLAYLALLEQKVEKQKDRLSDEQKRRNAKAAASVYVPYPGHRGPLANSSESSYNVPRSRSFSDWHYH